MVSSPGRDARLSSLAKEASHRGEGAVFSELAQWLHEHDIADAPEEFVGSPDACLALIPRVLQPNAGRVSERYAFTGPAIDESRIVDPNRWAPLDQGSRPMVYLALGTSYTDRRDLYRTAIDALAEDHRLVIATGKVDSAMLGPLPPEVDAARHQPQLDVLHHADVFIMHAGMGSAAEALWFGVPAVAIPQAVDQFQNAEMLEAAGAAVHLPDEEVTPEALRRAVQEASALRPRAEALREAVRRTGGVTGSADAVERLAAAGPPRPRGALSVRERPADSGALASPVPDVQGLRRSPAPRPTARAAGRPRRGR